MSAREMLLVYDRECPVCEAYCRGIARQGSLPGLKLVDARTPSAVLEEITRRGLDIDEGMALKVDGTLYYGAEAIHALAVLGGAASALERGNRWLFGSAHRTRRLYPLLRAGRGLLLKALRRTRINNLEISGRERF
jgi:predicted DCC family thiol-disulfide oxidoreductase YuxK